MRLTTIPGLADSSRLEELRGESMRTAQRNLRKQAQARAAASIMTGLAARRKAAHKND
ncbi:hypothetical protein B1400_0736 [Bifidobacterium italicum]|uniref:Uncharacterized protein n=2 Tax=Bifidobacterium italicum TaxID=1960968 RepID=A0A2A2EKM3_9BIFI|nr:hypothetical protein B1400_0736 [Bifidobacterium italicum]